MNRIKKITLEEFSSILKVWNEKIISHILTLLNNKNEIYGYELFKELNGVKSEVYKKLNALEQLGLVKSYYTENRRMYQSSSKCIYYSNTPVSSISVLLDLIRIFYPEDNFWGHIPKISQYSINILSKSIETHVIKEKRIFLPFFDRNKILFDKKTFVLFQVPPKAKFSIPTSLNDNDIIILQDKISNYFFSGSYPENTLLLKINKQNEPEFIINYQFKHSSPFDHKHKTKVCSSIEPYVFKDYTPKFTFELKISPKLKIKEGSYVEFNFGNQVKNKWKKVKSKQKQTFVFYNIEKNSKFNYVIYYEK